MTAVPVRLIAGDGRVARALYTALTHAGCVVRTWSRRHGGPIPHADEILVAVKDNAISEVAELLVAAQPEPPVVLHCAGALPATEAFGHVLDRCKGAALLHPLRALSGAESSLEGTVFGIEGDAVGRVVAATWVALLRGTPLSLDAQQLGRYHAAAVLVANHALGLVDAARALLVQAGLPVDVAVHALGRLLASSAENVVQRGLPEALTGPIARGDLRVVERHLQELAGHPQETLYRQTARPLLLLARQLGEATPESLAAIAQLLGEG